MLIPNSLNYPFPHPFPPGNHNFILQVCESVVSYKGTNTINKGSTLSYFLILSPWELGFQHRGLKCKHSAHNSSIRVMQRV